MNTKPSNTVLRHGLQRIHDAAHQVGTVKLGGTIPQYPFTVLPDGRIRASHNPENAVTDHFGRSQLVCVVKE
jgi:hypothetical protein